MLVVLTFPLSKNPNNLTSETFSSSSRRTLKTYCKIFRKLVGLEREIFLFEAAENRDKIALAELQI